MHCASPPQAVGNSSIKGTVSTSTLTLANGVNYTAVAGFSKSTLVNLGNYDLMLPNMMTYTIVVTYRAAGGVVLNNYNKTCPAGNFVLNAIAGVSNLTDYRPC